MAGDTSEGSRQLDQTPTWAVAGVCATIIIISIALEKILHKLGKFFTEKRKKAMFEALEKVKAELMVLGFISLLLTFSQYYIAKICIPDSIADTMLPCPVRDKPQKDDKEEGSHRLLLWYEHRRSLAEASKSSCKKGEVAIITVDGLHQLHILIFFLAVLHVAYSAVTMALGRLKIRGWKQLTHETSFVKAHTSFWTRIPFFFYIGCFFRQFFRSVSKSDYLTVRNGFINVHLARGSKFNFQKYVKRSLEDDFQVVVGISPVLWASFVIFLLLNVNGWQAMFWASLLPLVVILAVGTKLQAILTKMALEITERHAVVQGIPLVQGSDKYFWFSKPHLILHLIHFALFQNAFQITYFFWIWVTYTDLHSRPLRTRGALVHPRVHGGLDRCTKAAVTFSNSKKFTLTIGECETFFLLVQYEYKIGSCFHDNIRLVILKLIIGVGVLILCSYITLPLYALVSQMGSNMKKSIFDEQTSKALMNWRMAVKKKRGGGGGSTGGNSPTRTIGNTFGPIPTPSMPSSVGPLQRFKTMGHSPPSMVYKDTDVSDLESEPMSPESSSMHLLKVRVDHQNMPRQRDDTKNEDDFSFDKPAPLS
ncbi:Mlo-related protein [Cynara cardunculus var. scolymus]|uniref:MLO-like protein n=1 Tax=Cynara cardunculus var. scolymus TaxID=59895 RepID=A0A124SFE3_CYNCS|nr:Mlo-related protein [Cynara cardunculus var. scolymus]